MTDGLIVLVVEDHDFQRRTTARMLRSLGAREVLEASNGRQALALLAGSAQVDIVLCDLDMPEVDGMELIRHIGEANSTASVIIASAQERSVLASVEKMADAYGIRMLGVIEKPVTFSALDHLTSRHTHPEPQRTFAAESGFGLGEILRGLGEQQFEPFFQPKLEMATGRLLGAEALARWRHPTRGVIAPHAFVSLLEQSGHIDELTFLMLERAADACRGWRERGLDLTVSVNLSLVSLTDTTLAGRITKVVRSRGLDPAHMILEITETTALTAVAPALENLNRLRMRGFGLSIDDFGTGFASLQQLMRIPFTELKIDQSFVTGWAANPSLRTICESSVEMARRLNIASVAEGVETQADWDGLKATGCGSAQGHLVARPMDGTAFLDFFAAPAARAA